jgi:hypothetical protein
MKKACLLFKMPLITIGVIWNDNNHYASEIGDTHTIKRNKFKIRSQYPSKTALLFDMQAYKSTYSLKIIKKPTNDELLAASSISCKSFNRLYIIEYIRLNYRHNLSCIYNIAQFLYLRTDGRYYINLQQFI